MVFIPTPCRSWHLDFYPPQFYPYFTGSHFVYKALPFHQKKQHSIDSFLDWEGHHWVFISRSQTTTSDLLELFGLTDLGRKLNTIWGKTN